MWIWFQLSASLNRFPLQHYSLQIESNRIDQFPINSTFKYLSSGVPFAAFRKSFPAFCFCFSGSDSVSLFFRFLIALWSGLVSVSVSVSFFSYLYLFLYQFRRMKIGLDTIGGFKSILIAGVVWGEGVGIYGVWTPDSYTYSWFLIYVKCALWLMISTGRVHFGIERGMRGGGGVSMGRCDHINKSGRFRMNCGQWQQQRHQHQQLVWAWSPQIDKDSTLHSTRLDSRGTATLSTWLWINLLDVEIY